MRLWEAYRKPDTVQDALAELASANGKGRVIAGGTDLLLDMQQGRESPVEVLVDVSAVEAMNAIEEVDGSIFVGGSVTHHRIIQHELLQLKAQCLVEACGLIGGPQVRHVATLGGNVAHALPAGDGTIALMALGAEAQVATPDGTQWYPMDALFSGPGETTFNRTSDILVGFRFPASVPGEGSAFRRVMRPQGVAIAILNMAARLMLSQEGTIDSIQLAVGPAGPVPMRVSDTEKYLVGQPINSDTWDTALEILLTETTLRTSPHRATKEYRQHLIRVLLERTLEASAARAAK